MKPPYYYLILFFSATPLWCGQQEAITEEPLVSCPTQCISYSSMPVAFVGGAIYGLLSGGAKCLFVSGKDFCEEDSNCFERERDPCCRSSYENCLNSPDCELCICCCDGLCTLYECAFLSPFMLIAGSACGTCYEGTRTAIRLKNYIQKKPDNTNNFETAVELSMNTGETTPFTFLYK